TTIVGRLSNKRISELGFKTLVKSFFVFQPVLFPSHAVMRYRHAMFGKDLVRFVLVDRDLRRADAGTVVRYRQLLELLLQSTILTRTTMQGNEHGIDHVLQLAIGQTARFIKALARILAGNA